MDVICSSSSMSQASLGHSRINEARDAGEAFERPRTSALVNDAGNGQVTTTPLPTSALASSMATNRTGMEIGFITTGGVSEKGAP
jgi:hypothetical protein